MNHSPKQTNFFLSTTIMPGRFLFSIRRISRHSCQGFCSISSVGPQGLCVWSNSFKWGAGNTYMPLHDHPYSDVHIIYSVVQTGERTTDRVTNSAHSEKTHLVSCDKHFNCQNKIILLPITKWYVPIEKLKTITNRIASNLKIKFLLIHHVILVFKIAAINWR